MIQEQSPCCGFLGCHCKPQHSLDNRRLCSRPGPHSSPHSGVRASSFLPVCCTAVSWGAGRDIPPSPHSLAVLTLVHQESNS